MFSYIRYYRKSVSFFLLGTFILGFLPDAYSLSSGPSQPETQQFAPAGMDNMVDPFTGDFSYNIPLLDVGGYPVNINYSAGLTPDTEASWVGLGWGLSVGAINRNVRGLPDDFAGDPVTKDFNIKPNQTYGVSGRLSFEAIGFKLKDLNIGLSANLFYNNYNGFGLSLGVSPSVSAGLNSKNSLTGSLGLSASLGSESGLEVAPTLGLRAEQKEKENGLGLNSSISFPFSSREGLKGMSLSSSFSKTSNSYNVKQNSDGSTSLSQTSAVGGVSLNAYQGFASPTYTPSLEHNMYNVNASLNLTFSPTNPVWENPAFGFGGYYSGQFLKETTRSTPAYGYMFSGLSQSEEKLMDFNREKDGGFTKFTTNLPVTNFTYDVFQVSGQGIGGAYRLYRGDVGAVHDPLASDQGYSPAVGLEFGVGSTPSAKFGADVQFNYTQSKSGRWADDNPNIKHFTNENEVKPNNTESAYFKRIGEMNPEVDNEFLNDIQQKYKPFRLSLKNSFFGDGDGSLDGTFKVKENNEGGQSSKPIQANNQRTQRRPRVNSFTTLTANEAISAAILPIESYSGFELLGKGEQDRSKTASNEMMGYIKQRLQRKDSNRKGHHISEARVTDESGQRYIYGIPAYNNVQEEVTFALPGSEANATTGLIQYTPGKDDAAGNKNGRDHYFNKVSTPAFAHSYLLTCILSSDYVDRDGIQGPSEGDLGTYTKFNYTKAIDQFKWRTPIGMNTASFNEGMRGTREDDKASYVYGEKEIWYLHSIETKTHVAEFHLGDRKDGLGVSGREGAVGSERLKYLDKIVLYSKPDKWNSSGEPVKTVHFSYDYSLCPNTPNSTAENKGKLTLKKIWFTYGKSGKGVVNPYVFNYADQDFDGKMDASLNPSYDIGQYDRWGNYKAGNTNNLSNVVFPYAEQDKATADKYAAVWALSSIETPTGGTMRVYYESDDYAYVQNKKAMRMFKVAGDGKVSLDKNTLEIDLAEGFVPSSNNHNQEFRDRYLSGIDLMYYKALLKVLNRNVTEDRYDFVPGYAAIDPLRSSLVANSRNEKGAYMKAVIALKPVGPSSGEVLKNSFGGVNPIKRNGWMFVRLYLNRELNNSGNAEDSGLEQVLRALLSQATSIVKMLTGFTVFMMGAGHSNELDASKSFVRLNDPDKKKLGGGHRVKAIVMVDNWGLMKSEKETKDNLPSKETSYYGQAYNYTFNESNGQVISAGVASYEPMMGGEENPFRRPVFVKEKVPLAPAKEYFLEEPFGESFFPAPAVGYRKVTITPLKVTSGDLNLNQLEGNGTGKVEHEFYTAYDFPTKTSQTDLRTERHKPNLIFKFMKFDNKDLVTCTQGYSIELNDMHGKPKAQRVYAEYALVEENGIQKASENKPISEVEYKYKQHSDGSLNNDVRYINPDLSITEGSQAPQMGVDVDVVHDERFSETTTIGGGVQFNLKYIQLAIIPLFIPSVFPDFNSEKTRFRSVVTTKVINKYGILETTIAKDNGAAISTQNLAWDKYTGQVLLTKVDNEFHDPLYNFTYPGYWAYDKMDQAGKNEGMFFTSLGSVLEYLTDGDEVYLDRAPILDGPYSEKRIGYVDASGGSKKIISHTGEDWSSVFTKAKVIRSGHRNMASVPVGTVVTLDNPINGNQIIFSKILNAGASEFQESWRRSCACKEEEGAKAINNPFVTGLRGNMRPVRSWAYLTERVQTRVNNNLNIRKDGYYNDFSTFWQPGVVRISPPANASSTNWQFVTEIKNYNSVGMEIENRDALKRYSMAQFGYGQNLPVATSNNSRYRETGFDGFEDYDFGNCEDDHFRWKEFKESLTNTEAHTGKKSIHVKKSESLKIRKVIVECE